MTPHGSGFVINHNAGGTVGVYKTETEARQGMADCQRDDLMLEAARAQVERAVSALMRTHHIDRQAAHDWIREAAG
jgi:AmiR/NasT family two-component response regulator